MERILYLSFLYDFYQELLTEKQRAFFSRCHFDDMSLNEMGAEFGVTPQAVRDLLQRTEKSLINYENKLHLIQRHFTRKEQVDEICKKLDVIQFIREDEKNKMIQSVQDLIN